VETIISEDGQIADFFHTTLRLMNLCEP
jgi:hypothetical protein